MTKHVEREAHLNRWAAELVDDFIESGVWPSQDSMRMLLGATSNREIAKLSARFKEELRAQLTAAAKANRATVVVESAPELGRSEEWKALQVEVEALRTEVARMEDDRKFVMIETARLRDELRSQYSPLRQRVIEARDVEVAPSDGDTDAEFIEDAIYEGVRRRSPNRAGD